MTCDWTDKAFREWVRAITAVRLELWKDINPEDIEIKHGTSFPVQYELTHRDGRMLASGVEPHRIAEVLCMVWVFPQLLDRLDDLDGENSELFEECRQIGLKMANLEIKAIKRRQKILQKDAIIAQQLAEIERLREAAGLND